MGKKKKCAFCKSPNILDSSLLVNLGNKIFTDYLKIDICTDCAYYTDENDENNDLLFDAALNGLRRAWGIWNTSKHPLWKKLKDSHLMMLMFKDGKLKELAKKEWEQRRAIPQNQK